MNIKDTKTGKDKPHADKSANTAHKMNSIPEKKTGGARPPIGDKKTNLGNQKTSNPKETSSLGSIISEIDQKIQSTYKKGGIDTFTKKESDKLSRDMEQYIIFKLSDKLYGIPLNDVQEIERIQKITAVPNVPQWLYGVTNLRGNILSVIDLSGFFRMNPSNFQESYLALIVCLQNDDMVTSLIIDKLIGKRNIEIKRIKTPSANMDEGLKPYLKGVCENQDELLTLIDMNLFLNSPEIRQFEQE